MTSRALTNKELLNIVGATETEDDVFTKAVGGVNPEWVPASAVTLPAGLIVLWSGSVASIPTGWVLCDGTNSTPDLRNRFIVGAGSTYAVDATGGSADAVVVSHTHTASSTSTSTFTGNSGSTHSHTIQLYDAEPTSVVGTGAARAPGIPNGTQSTSSNSTNPSGSVSTTTTTTVNSAGVSGTNANLPPYYALAYIMKT